MSNEDSRYRLSAVFVDVENMTLNGTTDPSDFDIGRVMQRVEALSRPIVRRAYADWTKVRGLRTSLLRHAFDQVQTTYINQSKNGLDMQMCVDAMEVALLQADIQVIFLITADSDFSALARALRRHGREVVGIGWHDKTNDIFRAHCDLFIDYDDLTAPAGGRAAERPPDRALPPVRRDRVAAGRRGPPPRRLPAQQDVFLHDPRYDEGTNEGDLTSTLVDALEPEDEVEGALEGGPAGSNRDARPLEAVNGAIADLVAEHGPGARLYASRFMKAMRKAEPGFSPAAFGCRTLTEFVRSHPLLRCDAQGRGPNFSIILPDEAPREAPGEVAGGVAEPGPAADLPAPAVDLVWLDEAPVVPEREDEGAPGGEAADRPLAEAPPVMAEGPETADFAPETADSAGPVSPENPCAPMVLPDGGEDGAGGMPAGDDAYPVPPDDDAPRGPFGRSGWWRRR